MFSYTNIEDYHSSLKNGKTSCTAAVDHYLGKIAAFKKLNAFVEVYADEAREKAKTLDVNRSMGITMKKLHGVVIAIKDVICYKDHRVSAASGMLQDFVSLYTSTALQYLLDEDAIIIGNCNCDEFAMGNSNEHSFYGKVLNAADHTRVPGGSSGGSAVAVQAELCMISLGSDTGGSVRQPADFCGIIGFKPGYGTISRYGLIAYASSFDQIGIFGRNILDIELVLKIMQQPDPRDSTITRVLNEPCVVPKDKKYTFCYFKEGLEHPSLDTEIAAAILELIVKLKDDGHTVNEVGFNLMNHIVPAYYVLTTAEASSNLARYDGVNYGFKSDEDHNDITELYSTNRTKGFGTEVKRRIMLGTYVLSAGYYEAYFDKAQRIRRMLTDQMDAIFDKCDAIISPTTPTPAFLAGNIPADPTESYLADLYTVLANLTGLPAISLPLFSHSYSIPFGIQVMTNRKEEVSLLTISEMLMNRKKDI
ncbi:MAG: Asp-tRNA(Asn)/Glu-tRNA(Gln) amidotransferase subunit GatA [Ferruginibacter sp.]